MTYQKNEKMLQLEEELERLGIDCEFTEHPAITSVQEGLQFLGIQPYQGVASMLLKSKDMYYLVFRRDDHRIDYKKVKKHLGVSDLQMASREEVNELLGTDVGYVSFYNPGYEPIIDKTIFEIDYVYGGTGSLNYDLKIRPDDLLRLTNGQKADIAGADINYDLSE